MKGETWRLKIKMPKRTSLTDEHKRHLSETRKRLFREGKLINYLIDMNCKEDEMKINRITKQIRNKLQNKLH